MRIFCLLALCTSSALSVTHHPQPSNKSPHQYDSSPTSVQRSRRLQGPAEHKRVSFPHYTNSRSPPSAARKLQNKKNGVPPYAVQMDPMVQYSQPDPLYTIEKQYISEAKIPDLSNNDLIKKSFNQASVGDIKEAESISRAGSIVHASTRLRPPPRRSPPLQQNHHHHHHHPLSDIAAVPPSGVEFSSYGTYYEGPSSAFEEQEPIIEIIIKESNESLPAPPPPPTPPPRKKSKEPVQVFYVKYKKDPAGGYGGEEKVIYDPPVPAVTPPSNVEESHEEHEADEPVIPIYHEESTLPPPPSTTLKAIIRPDSETFHASGVHITFGEPQDNGYGPNHHGELEQQSAPQPAVAFPTKTPESTAKPLISRSSNGGLSQLTKRTPAPFNGPQQSFQSFQQTQNSFQQLPQFPAQDFQPPSLNPSQYSTLPQHLQFQKPQQPFPVQPQFPQPQQQFAAQPQQQFAQQPQPQPQRYHTINNPPPPQPTRAPSTPVAQTQYHTINSNIVQTSNFQHFVQPAQPPQISNPFQQQRAPIREPSQEQHQQQVEQLNRLQQQQQQLQQQQQQPQLRPQSTFVQQASQSFVPQASQDIRFPEPSQQHNHFAPSQQQLPVQQQPQQYNTPQLQYPQDSLLAQRNNIQNHKTVEVETQRPVTVTRPTLAPTFYKRTTTSTTSEPTTPEIVTEDPRKLEEEKKKNEKKVKENVLNLPDEVPDDLREQLLSSGILSNADIQILDYDKIGDIPIENLPPEALANFQQATAGSERREQRVRPEAEDADDSDSASSSSEQQAVAVRSSSNDGGDMEMKVVRFNPQEDESVADRYVRQGATQLAPVVLNDSKYNRYLPLKVAGAQFPVPDVPELRGRNVTSVVVLAPVDYEFLTRHDTDGESRVGRSASPALEVQGVHFIAGDVLKALVKMPSTENYRRWLQKENETVAEKQSVVLLVVAPTEEHPEKEIFMYDIASGRVSKLRGELSATFVQVAESNSTNQDLEEISDSPAGPGGDFTVKESSQLLSGSNS